MLSGRRGRQRRQFHPPRLRRERFGELVQIDGSEHRWFEDRADPCTLLVFIDDATGRLMQLRFAVSESHPTPVIPAKAGLQGISVARSRSTLIPRLRGDDGFGQIRPPIDVSKRLPGWAARTGCARRSWSMVLRRVSP